MENIRKHRNIKLVTSRESYLKTIMKPNYKSGVLFGENLMGCDTGKNDSFPLYVNILENNGILRIPFKFQIMEVAVSIIY